MLCDTNLLRENVGGPRFMLPPRPNVARLDDPGDMVTIRSSGPSVRTPIIRIQFMSDEDDKYMLPPESELCLHNQRVGQTFNIQYIIIYNHVALVTLVNPSEKFI